MNPRSSRLLRALAGAALLAACAVPPAPPVPPPPAPPAPPSTPPPPPSPPCEKILWIEIQKSARRLDAACLGGGHVSWTVALGRQPGLKRAAGDHRTPEGLYHVVGRPRPSRFHRFLAIDYPSRGDAERARAEGRLPARDFERVATAHEAGSPPPADTALGGHLGFHGEGARWHGDSAHLDWTDGCVGMTDDAIDFLAARTAPGTPVQILP